MPTRKIIDYAGNEIGDLTLPSSTAESEWQERLASYVISPEQALNNSIAFNISERRRFADSLIESFKKENITAGINISQALHMHDLLRRVAVNFSGEVFELDLMNLVMSGDLEVAAIGLMYMTNLDDGSQLNHWFTAGRRDWVVGQIKSYLGWS